MAANTNSTLTLSSLDFDTLKDNFKSFLQSQDKFKDYDYNGSNISVLLDILSYNSYLNSFYLNMAVSEMFLDSAQLYDSVISHSKELNYVPASARSSSAKINFTVDVLGQDGILTLPKGTRFRGYNSNSSYIFTTNNTLTILSSNDTFSTSNLEIFEGEYYQDTYIVNYNEENQKFLLTNQKSDINSVVVNVTEDSSSKDYKRKDHLFGLNGNSEIYFIQPSRDNLYEIVFGDGLFGKKPKHGATVKISYRVTFGEEADNINAFDFVEDYYFDIPNIEVVEISSGGAEQESIESVKFAAPRYFATQQRAVSSDDYSSLVFSQFSNEVSDVNVYGGQEVVPKQYGKVMLAIKPSVGVIASQYLKDSIYNYLQEYIALPNRIVIEDPDYFYCSVISKVQYDQAISTKSPSELQSDCISSIVTYSKNNLEIFGKDLRYSKLVKQIDDSDASITSNDTEIRIVKKLTPAIGTDTSYNIQTGNEIYYNSTVYVSNTVHESYHTSSYDLHSEHTSILSSRFTYNSNDGKTYPLSFIEEDQKGNLVVFVTVADQLVKNDIVGSVDYATGEINIENINVADYTGSINLYIKTDTKDILSKQNKILIIDPADITVDIIEQLV
jgi:hypothetical protein